MYKRQAYAAAQAAARLKEDIKQVDIYASGNIIKNVKSVTVPNTGGRKGIQSAAAIGIIAGDPSLGLEVISHVRTEQIAQMEAFLEKAEAGEACETEVYEIHADGGYGRYRFYFDGQNMRVAIAVVTWNTQGPVSMGNYEYQIENWSYTEKGWFSYTLDVPEPPEVSEVIQDPVSYTHLTYIMCMFNCYRNEKYF